MLCSAIQMRMPSPPYLEVPVPFLLWCQAQPLASGMYPRVAVIEAVFCLQSFRSCWGILFPFCLQQPRVLWWGSTLAGLSSNYCSSSGGDFEALENLFLTGWSISGNLAAPQLEGTLSFNGAEEGAVLNTLSGKNWRFHTNVMNCWAHVCKNVSLLGPVAQGHFKDSFKTERKRKALQVGEGGAAITLLLRWSGPCWIPTASYPHRPECAREKKNPVSLFRKVEKA